jgi:hypothetical protein
VCGCNKVGVAGKCGFNAEPVRGSSVQRHHDKIKEEVCNTVLVISSHTSPSRSLSKIHARGALRCLAVLC